MRSVAPSAAGDRCLVGIRQQLDHAIDRGHRPGHHLGRQPRALRHLVQVPQQAKTRHVRQRAGARLDSGLGRLAVELRHHRDRLIQGRLQAALDRRRHGPRPQRLGEHELIPGTTGSVCEEPIGVGDASDGQAVLGLGVVYRVAADDRTSGLGGNRRPATQNLDQHLGSELLQRERHQVQGADRGCGHRVDVGQGVGGRDAAEVERVVDDRGEEIDCLDERQVVCEPIYAGVVGGLERDQHVWIVV